MTNAVALAREDHTLRLAEIEYLGPRVPAILTLSRPSRS